MNMIALAESAALPIWDDERSKLRYRVPLEPAAADGGESLLTGIPRAHLKRCGPFLVTVSQETHIGPFYHALDFLVADGSVVLAAQAGRISACREESRRWGDSAEFVDDLNFVTIDHGDGEFSQYCHLDYLSVTRHRLRVGDKVEAGQPIALVGKSGWTDRDHLHFIVFRTDQRPENPFGFKSLKIRFQLR